MWLSGATGKIVAVTAATLQQWFTAHLRELLLHGHSRSRLVHANQTFRAVVHKIEAWYHGLHAIEKFALHAGGSGGQAGIKVM